MITKRRVLVVDSQEATGEVCRASLGSRGIEVLSANSTNEGLRMAQDFRPDVIVLDLESAPNARCVTPADFESASQKRDSSLILLGSIRREARPAGSDLISKPYHYGALIRKIESLLSETSAAA